ncbi:elongation factor 4 [Spirochaetota bacterium]|nr:elongation factor 4 [Spirochaetota bacterium]
MGENFVKSSEGKRVALANIRNFCIIAHIDHGKSTLSDRILECANVLDRNAQHGSQVLDSLEIEKERGITVKSAAITFFFQAADGTDYLLNLIDTPGHVDFSYEVKRSLASCEGAVLIVDASQGVEAQTLSNFYLALESELEVVPVINKIDLPSADVPSVRREMAKEFAFLEESIIPVSAKTGVNIKSLLEQIVLKIPPPYQSHQTNVKHKSTVKEDPKRLSNHLNSNDLNSNDLNSNGLNSSYANAPAAPSVNAAKVARHADEMLRALIFDSFYDTYRGVIVCVRVFSGVLAKGCAVQFVLTKKRYTVEEVGWLGLTRKIRDRLTKGEVGYVILSIRSVREFQMGDTLALAEDPAPQPLPGYREVKPMIFAGIFPIESDKFNELKANIEKLSLNDAALVFQADNSLALGFGFRCGFLGLLHMEIVQERLSREFKTEVIVTAPSVNYRIKLKHHADPIMVDNPAKFPSLALIEEVLEPYIKATLIFPSIYLGGVLQLLRDRRGIQNSLHYLNEKRVETVFAIPLGEFIFDFHDLFKSITRGYGSLDYDFDNYRPGNIIKVDILINKEVTDALSFMVHRDKARARAKTILEKLRNEIPRQLFKIPLQAAVGSNILARENISALRKDVTSKCYGGDITRKRKLLEKQKTGKKKMKAIGSVEIPQKAFLNILKTS